MAMMIPIEGAQFALHSIMFSDFHPYICCKIRRDDTQFAYLKYLFYNHIYKIINHIIHK